MHHPPLTTPPETTASVAIIEDDPGLAHELRHLIDASELGHWVATYTRAEDAVTQLPHLSPRILFIDINLPGMSGIDAVQALAPILTSTYFIMLTIHDDTDVIFRALQAGAMGYLRKPVTQPQVTTAIRDALDGGAPMSASIARRIIGVFRPPPQPQPAFGQDVLTRREREILSLLAKGFQYKEISQELAISVATVNSHAMNMYRKLQVESRYQAVALYHQHQRHEADADKPRR